MTYSTTLANEPGIVIRNEIADENNQYVDSVSVIVGQFKRGRTDRPMKVTADNVRAVLGHDPRNHDYLAVLDALETGIDHVMVMRVVITSITENTIMYWDLFNWDDGSVWN